MFKPAISFKIIHLDLVLFESETASLDCQRCDRKGGITWRSFLSAVLKGSPCLMGQRRRV